MALLDAIKNGQWFNIQATTPKFINMAKYIPTKEDSGSGSRSGGGDVDAYQGLHGHTEEIWEIDKHQKKLENEANMIMRQGTSLDISEEERAKLQNAYGAITQKAENLRMVKETYGKNAEFQQQRYYDIWNDNPKGNASYVIDGNAAIDLRKLNLNSQVKNQLIKEIGDPIVTPGQYESIREGFREGSGIILPEATPKDIMSDVEAFQAGDQYASSSVRENTMMPTLNPKFIQEQHESDTWMKDVNSHLQQLGEASGSGDYFNIAPGTSVTELETGLSTAWEKTRESLSHNREQLNSTFRNLMNGISPQADNALRKEYFTKIKQDYKDGSYGIYTASLPAYMSEKEGEGDNVYMEGSWLIKSTEKDGKEKFIFEDKDGEEKHYTIDQIINGEVGEKENPKMKSMQEISANFNEYKRLKIASTLDNKVNIDEKKLLFGGVSAGGGARLEERTLEYSEYQNRAMNRDLAPTVVGGKGHGDNFMNNLRIHGKINAGRGFEETFNKLNYGSTMLPRNVESSSSGKEHSFVAFEDFDGTIVYEDGNKYTDILENSPVVHVEANSFSPPVVTQDVLESTFEDKDKLNYQVKQIGEINQVLQSDEYRSLLDASPMLQNLVEFTDAVLDSNVGDFDSYSSFKDNVINKFDEKTLMTIEAMGNSKNTDDVLAVLEQKHPDEMNAILESGDYKAAENLFKKLSVTGSSFGFFAEVAGSVRGIESDQENISIQNGKETRERTNDYKGDYSYDVYYPLGKNSYEIIGQDEWKTNVSEATSARYGGRNDFNLPALSTTTWRVMTKKDAMEYIKRRNITMKDKLWRPNIDDQNIEGSSSRNYLNYMEELLDDPKNFSKDSKTDAKKYRKTLAMSSYDQSVIDKIAKNASSVDDFERYFKGDKDDYELKDGYVLIKTIQPTDFNDFNPNRRQGSTGEYDGKHGY